MTQKPAKRAISHKIEFKCSDDGDIRSSRRSVVTMVPEVVLNFPLFCTRSLSLSVFPWKRDFRSNLCWLLRRMAVLRGNRYDYGKLWGLWESICGSGVTLKRRTMQIGCIFRKDGLDLISWKRMFYFEGGKILCYSLDLVFPLKTITKLN